MLTNKQADSIAYTLKKVADMLEVFPIEYGAALIQETVNASNYANMPQIGERDIKTLRWVIFTGIINDKRLRPGLGFEVLSMAIMLKNMIEKSFADQCAAHDAEIIEVLARMWQMKIEANDGDKSKAKKQVAQTWGSYPMDEHTKYLFNQSFKLANGQQTNI